MMIFVFVQPVNHIRTPSDNSIPGGLASINESIQALEPAQA